MKTRETAKKKKRKKQKRKEVKMKCRKRVELSKTGQVLWILLNNQKWKIRTEASYGPQKNMAPSNELKLLHKSIAEQIEITKEKHQQVLMLEDFNVKILNHIPGNKEAVSKGGKQIGGIDKYKTQMKTNAKGNGQENKEKRDQ